MGIGAVGAGVTRDVKVAVTGPASLAQGFALWRHRPGLMLLGALPALIVLVLLVSGFVALLSFSDTLADWMTPFLDGAGEGVRDTLRLALRLGLVVGYGLASWLTFVALTLMVGDPFYARIHAQTELILGPPVPVSEVGFWRAVKDSLRLLAFGLVLALTVVLLGLLPVVGTVVGAVAGFVVSGRLLAGELLARPLEARGLDAAARKPLLAANRWRVLGFGLCVQACFVVPFGAVVAMPAAVVGATRLARGLLGEPCPTWDEAAARVSPGPVDPTR